MMTYQSFLLAYYRMVVTELNQYCHYCGTHYDVNYGFAPDLRYIRKASHNNDILPNYEFTDDVPVKMIEEFFDYYGNLYPDNKLFMTPISLKGLYDFAMKNFKKKDKQIEYIKFLTQKVFGEEEENEQQPEQQPSESDA